MTGRKGRIRKRRGEESIKKGKKRRAGREKERSYICLFIVTTDYFFFNVRQQILKCVWKRLFLTLKYAIGFGFSIEYIKSEQNTNYFH